MAEVPSTMTKSDQESATKTSPEDVPSPKKSLDDFISALPAREGWARPLIQYKKYWFNPVMLKQILLAEQAFVPRADDIILAAQPKSGTTWLKALVFATANRARYSFGDDHPLLTRHAQDVVPYIEIPGAGTHHHSDDVESLPSPRILATHIPLSLLPPDTTTRGCRIVYVCRDPKDVLVSRWHFENSFTKQVSNLSMDNAFTMFCEGFSPYGPLWDHCREYWEASRVRPNHILFIKYEEIKADPVQVVRKLATFLGIPLTQEEETSGVAQEVARMCSFEMLTSLQVSKVGVTHHVGNQVYVRSSSFYRKGKVGDWTNHMSKEMGEKLDGIVQEKLKGSGLVF